MFQLTDGSNILRYYIWFPSIEIDSNCVRQNFSAKVDISDVYNLGKKRLRQNKEFKQNKTGSKNIDIYFCTTFCCYGQCFISVQ